MSDDFGRERQDIYFKEKKMGKKKEKVRICFQQIKNVHCIGFGKLHLYGIKTSNQANKKALK